MIDLREVRSVTEFQRNIKDYVGRLKKNKTPLVLTVNGRAELVVRDAESYQLILERWSGAETLASIRRGMEQFDRGEGIPLDEVEEQLRKKHGFSRSDCSTGRGQPRHNLYIHRSTGQVYNCGAMFAFSHARHWAMKPIEADELEDLMDEAASAGREPEEST